MIEFFFDCSSPWTYLAFHNIQPLAKEFGEEISWRPILVGGIFNTINPSVYASREKPVEAKVAYQKKDMRQHVFQHLGWRELLGAKARDQVDGGKIVKGGNCFLRCCFMHGNLPADGFR